MTRQRSRTDVGPFGLGVQGHLEDLFLSHHDTTPGIEHLAFGIQFDSSPSFKVSPPPQGLVHKVERTLP